MYDCLLLSAFTVCIDFYLGFFRELWHLARAIILAFFIAVLISSVFSAQMRGGSECATYVKLLDLLITKMDLL